MDALSLRRVWKAARPVLVVTLLALAPIVVASKTEAVVPFADGDLQRVSLDSAGAQLRTGATQPAISGNGRFVGFTTAENSGASNDTNGANDVYVRDTVAGTTTLISKFQNTTNGVAGDDSTQASLSNDGRWVAFTSKSTQWAGTPFTTSGVFVVDRGAPAADGSFPSAPGAPVLVSLAPGTTASVGGPADGPSISGAGSEIAFHFVTGGSNRSVIRDRDRNHNGAVAETGDDQASIDVTNGAPDRNSPKIAADGKHVAFVASDPAVSANAPRVVVYDRSVDGSPDLDQAGNTRFAVATTPAFSLTDGDGNPRPDPLLDTISATPALSGDGSVVVYAYSHPMKVPTPAGRLPNATFEIIAVHRAADGAPIAPIVVSADGSAPLNTGAGEQDSYRPVVSADGRYADFASAAQNLGSSGAQGANCGAPVPVARCDIFAVDLAAADADRGPQIVPRKSGIFSGNKRSFEVAISATGQFSAFTSDATNLAPSPDDTNNQPDVYVKEWLPSLTVTFAPEPLPDTPVGGTSGPFTVTVSTNEFGPWRAAQVSISGANTSDFSVAPQSCTQQIFHIGEPCLIALTFHPTASGLRNAQLQLTRASHKTTLDFGVVQGLSSLPRAPAAVERASLGPSGAPGVGATGQIDGESSSPAISANGRFVAFDTNIDLDPRDKNATDDVYVRDRLRGTTALASITPGAGSILGAPPSGAPSISGDGRFIAFMSVAQLTVTPGDDHPGRAAIYVLDRGAPDANGDFTAVPAMHFVAQANNASACDPDISGDGSQVAYWTTTPPSGGIFCSTFLSTQNAFVVDADVNGNGLPYEGAADQTQTALFTGNSANPRFPRISADGLHVVFTADTVLGGGEFGPTASVIFAYDRQTSGGGAKDGPGNAEYTQVTSPDFTPITAGDTRGSPLENTTSDRPVVSGDGNVIAYEFSWSNPTSGPQILSSPFPEFFDQIVVVRRDAAGNVTSTDVASEAGSAPPTFGDDDSTDADISDDGRYVAFSTTARTLLPHEPIDSGEGLFAVAVIADIVAPGHAGGPQMLAPSSDPTNATGMPESDQGASSVSADGRFVAFDDFSDDVLPFVGLSPAPSDSNDAGDVFLREARPDEPPTPPSVDFGAVPVGNSSALTSVQFATNDLGPDPVLSFAVIGTDPGDFNILGTTGCAPTLPDAPAAPVAAVPNYAILHLDTPCTVSLSFAPTVFGTRTAVLRVVTGTPFPANDPESLPTAAGVPPSRITTDVPLIGGVGAPAFQVTPVPLDFGLQTLGQLAPDQPLTVTNVGGSAFAIANATLTGANPADFTLTSDLCSGAVLNPLATCVVRVAFHSSAPGDRTAFVQFVDTAGGSPHLAPLTGRTPTLIVNPDVTTPGRTVNVIGMSWIPGQAVALTTVDTRDPAHAFSETRIVTVDGAGNFQTVMVMFPKTTPGSRFVIGTGLAPSATARAPLLVAFATAQAPNFVTRG